MKAYKIIDYPYCRGQKVDYMPSPFAERVSSATIVMHRIMSEGLYYILNDGNTVHHKLVVGFSRN